jgi:hypothetical protein
LSDLFEDTTDLNGGGGMSLLISGDLRLAKTPSTWAEGGDLVYTIVVSGTTYRVHEFKTVGTTSLMVMNGGSVEYLIIGGGSGGNAGVSGVNLGNGGAAGVARIGTAGVTAQVYNVVVGAGSPGVGVANSLPGGSSIALGFTATGGFASSNSGRTGASNADYSGGTNASSIASGGGAGAGANASSSVGGAGFSSDITGANIIRGGGGGGIPWPTTSGAGGSGGGGAGTASGRGENGAANTGSGGGGGPDSTNSGGGSGGSGIVIVRYAI